MKIREALRFYQFIVESLSVKDSTYEELERQWRGRNEAFNFPGASSLFRHRNNIEEEFGIKIHCNNCNRYYLDSKSKLSIKKDKGHWFYSLLSTKHYLNSSSTIKDRIILPEIPSGEKYLLDIQEGMKRSCTLNILYQPHNKDKPVPHIFNPYALKLYNNKWYTFGYSQEYQKHFYLCLDRVHGVEITKDQYELLPMEKVHALIGDFIGVYFRKEHEITNIEFSAFGSVPNYLKALPIHSSQKVLSQNNSYTKFSIEVANTPDLISKFQSYNETLLVEDPIEVALKVYEKHYRSSILYEKFLISKGVSKEQIDKIKEKANEFDELIAEIISNGSNL